MKPIPMYAIPRNSTQFREYLIASFFALIAQLRAMKWRKRKQPLRATEFQLETLILSKMGLYTL